MYHARVAVAMLSTFAELPTTDIRMQKMTEMRYSLSSKLWLSNIGGI